jgi:hypothetical protein
MAGSRTLKLSILADVDDLRKKLDTADNEVKGFAGKLEDFSEKAKVAFAAAAAAAVAYAGKLAIEGVQAAIADEAAQKRLQTALQNVTGATESQIQAIENQILKTSLATGVSDDQLRPALQRLAIATGNVESAQNLLKIALDISAATGKDLQTVSNALGKAYEGNTAALSKLGVGLTATEIKTLGVEEAVKQLSNTFGGSAATQAETFEGRIARVKVAFDETKETIGYALLPIIEKFLKFVTETAVPALQNFKKDAIDPVIAAFNRNKDSIEALVEFGKVVLVPFISFTLGNAIRGLASIASVVVEAVSIALRALEPLINAAIRGINLVIKGRNLLSSGPDIKEIPGLNFDGGDITQPNTVPGYNLPFGGITGGTQGKQSVYVDAFSGAIIPTPSSLGGTNIIGAASTTLNSITNSSGISSNPVVDMTINLNSPSIIDEEGFSRAVIEALNNSNFRGTGGAGVLV